jgi:ABC-type dipeptide/oligopeptide/nickel transport system permease component
MVVFIHVPRHSKVLGKPLLKLVFLFGMPLGRINKRRKNHFCKRKLKMILSLINAIKIFLVQKRNLFVEICPFPHIS